MELGNRRAILHYLAIAFVDCLEKKLNLLAITLFLFSFSFLLNLFACGVDSVGDFYSPQTRFWELLAGSMLAYLVQHNFQMGGKVGSWLRMLDIRRRKFRDAQSLIDAVFVIAGFLTITKEKFFPGVWALLPVLGAVCIIDAGSKSWVNRIFLMNRVMVWFGIISFPLYLWHWPLLSFARIIEFGNLPSHSVRIVAVLVSIFLSWLTYELIERPLRFGLHDKLKVMLLVLTMMIVAWVGFETYRREGLSLRHST